MEVLQLYELITSVLVGIFNINSRSMILGCHFFFLGGGGVGGVCCCSCCCCL